MRLKYKFVIYIIVLHAIILTMAYFFLRDQIYWFFAVEIFVAISAYLASLIYKHYIRPFNLMGSVVKSIHEREFSLRYINSPNPEINRMIRVFNEMIDQLREERRIQQEQHFFLEKLTEAMPIGVMVLDGNDHIKKLNPLAALYLQVQKNETPGKALREIDSDFAPVIAEMKENESRIIRLNGIQRFRLMKAHFIDRGFHNHFILMEELTNEILEMEKAAYGRVIRMMSHEVNNTTGAINSLVNSLEFYAPELSEENQQDFEGALRVITRRNENMNRFMNNFANVIRLPKPVIKSNDLVSFIFRIQMLMDAYCKQNQVTLRAISPIKTHFLDFDDHQMEQLMVNVIKNAVEAIDSEGKVSIVLDTGKNELRIEDNGSGISVDHQERLFTPFFSTKNSGQGIGLTISREIAMNHGFNTSLKNRLGKGAVFTIIFNTSFI